MGVHRECCLEEMRLVGAWKTGWGLDLQRGEFSRGGARSLWGWEGEKGGGLGGTWVGSSLCLSFLHHPGSWCPLCSLWTAEWPFLKRMKTHCLAFLPADLCLVTPLALRRSRFQLSGGFRDLHPLIDCRPPAPRPTDVSPRSLPTP